MNRQADLTVVSYGKTFARQPPHLSATELGSNAGRAPLSPPFKLTREAILKLDLLQREALRHPQGECGQIITHMPLAQRKHLVPIGCWPKIDHRSLL